MYMYPHWSHLSLSPYNGFNTALISVLDKPLAGKMPWSPTSCALTLFENNQTHGNMKAQNTQLIHWFYMLKDLLLGLRLKVCCIWRSIYNFAQYGILLLFLKINTKMFPFVLFIFAFPTEHTLSIKSRYSRLDLYRSINGIELRIHK